MFEVKPIVLLNCNCNFNCCFCYVRQGATQLPIEYMKLFYEKTIKPNNASIVHFAGGEPFLYKHFHELSQYLKSIHEENPQLQFNFTTNGSCINNELIDDLKHINVNMVKISMPSLRKDKYEKIVGVNHQIEKTIQNIEKLKQLFNVGINMTIMKDTVCDVEPLIRFCLDNGIHDLYFSQLTASGKGFLIKDEKLEKEEVLRIKELVNSIDKSMLNIRYDDGCNCGIYQNFAMNWDGDIYPCVALVSYPEYKIGRCGDSVEKMRNKINNMIQAKRKSVCFIDDCITY